MNVILTDSQVSRLESLNDQFQDLPARIARSNETFNFVLNNQQMIEWIQGTQAAQSVSAELGKNIETLAMVANLMQQVVEENKNIITWNRNNNSKTVR